MNTDEHQSPSKPGAAGPPVDMHLRALALDQVANAVFITAPDGAILWVNDAFVDMTGWTAQDAIGQTPRILKSGSQDMSHYQRLWATILAGRPWAGEVVERHRDGHHYRVWQTITPIIDDHGRVTHFVAVHDDVTEQREARQQVAFQTQLLDAVGDAVIVTDAAGDVAYVNPAARQLYGWGDRDVVGVPATTLNVPRGTRAEAEQIMDQVRAGRTWAGEFVVQRQDASTFTAWVTLAPYHDEDNQIVGLIGVSRDITPMQEALADLKARDAELQWQADLLDHAQDAIVVRDLHHTITYWNRGAEQIYGWSASEAVGSNHHHLLCDDPTQFDHAIRAVLKHGEWAGRLTQRTAAGGLVVADSRWSLVRDDDGNPDAILAITTDVTEWQRIEQQLLRTQRMESIGTLAGGVAHDLNNVLAPILLACDLLHTHGDDPQTRELVDLIAASARRGADLVTQVLHFARGVDGQHAAVDMTALLDDLTAIVRETFPRNIDLVADIPRHPRAIVGDATQIQQVLLNLAVNARDAMPDGGSLTITLSEMALDAQYRASRPSARSGDHLVIEFADTGIGMAADVRGRIFEPFFTTKPHGAGTGLGLSTSHSIVHSHGGFIDLDSAPGEGTRFRVHLPLAGSHDTTEPTPQPEQPPPQGAGQTILVIDDEDAVRITARQTLETNGYQCIDAANGAEAIAAFVEHLDQVAAVVVDMMMPIMDGPATIHALRTMTPGLPIIAASGVPPDHTARTDNGAAHRLLPKPYTARALLEALASVLDAAAT